MYGKGLFCSGFTFSNLSTRCILCYLSNRCLSRFFFQGNNLIIEMFFFSPIGLLFSKQFKVTQKACEDYCVSIMIKDILLAVDRLLEKYNHLGDLYIDLKIINIKSIEELRFNIKNNSEVFKKIG